MTVNFPECQTEDKNHMWGKWELFEKKSVSGFFIYTTTTQKAMRHMRINAVFSSRNR